MKVLFISDIHANLAALKAIEPYFGSVDKVICLGDIVGYGSHVNEVIAILKHYEIQCIMGNHDYFVINGHEKFGKKLNEAVLFGLDLAKETITKENFEWLKSLPLNYGFILGGRSILCCHGSPWDPLREYVYPDYQKFEKFNEFNYDVITLGHTHRMLQKQESNTLILNPGAVGQARDFEGKACAMILDTETLMVDELKLEYNFMDEIQHAQSLGAKEWIFKHFESVR